MNPRTILTALVTASLLLGGIAPARAQTKVTKLKTTQAERQAAANTSGITVQMNGTATMAMPGTAPHYFTVPNYANSPLRIADAVVTLSAPVGATATASATVDALTGAILSVAVTSGGSGYDAAVPPAVTISGTNTSPATAIATVDATGAVSAITLTSDGVLPLGGTGYGADLAIAIAPPVAGTPATATATVDLTTGAISAITITDPSTGYIAAPTVTISAPMYGSGTGATATATLGVIDPITGAVIDPTGVGAITVVTGGAEYASPGIRKFVDTLPGLTPAGANNLGNYIPVATADSIKYPGSDYYEIAVVEFMQQMHSDLPPTMLRGYVQLAAAGTPGAVALTDPVGNPIRLPDGTQAYGVDKPRYLGPVIVAQKNKPVRILFRNLLPTGVEGNLFLPVDTTVMGAGMGPLMAGMGEMDPQNPMAGSLPKPYEAYTENRATLHLHGGISPWISDGTPHQWITPANENTPYPKGVSVKNVPDMPDPGPGAMTFFYTNQQSARLMFYHDHAWGITRLNVYAGEAAGYLITDPTEQKLVSSGLIPSEQLLWVVQDKTFVPDSMQLAATDPLWDIARWGGKGNLWVPHVYSPAQNPGSPDGVNQFGRWAYGPWFWPPTNNIAYGPMANPYYDPMADPAMPGFEPAVMPGTPFVSMGMEAFNDTPVVNGTVYPSLTVEPKAYRIRVLNAANDRFFNLSLYVADASGKEVALNPAEVAGALTDPTIFPTPVAPAGPDWVQIATEGGFLPAPVVIPAQPTTWVNDPTVFNAGNVDQHSLLVAPAERADVIVDFSAFAGQTLIVYNDAPAAFPARDPRYDYYTGNPDLSDTGGAPATPAGYGPNTRTVMQIKVGAAVTTPSTFNLPALQAEFAHHLAPDASGILKPAGVFESSQNPIIVGQAEYNGAYGTAFPAAGPGAGTAQIFDHNLTFLGLNGMSFNFPLQPKMIQDEMGEAFDHEYGRMSGNLGVESPFAAAGVQTMILYPYVNPASEIMKGVELPVGQMDITPLGSTADGTQLWKITHNGVDTHPIHFHLYDVQLINRVGWDGIIRRPDANELGWKDTVRVSPLEDTIVAMRPIVPKQPFGLLDSIRPLNPMMPIGSTAGFNNTDLAGNPVVPSVVNEFVNFSWEYVWHCHILSHEEMDMMRPVIVNVSRAFAMPPMATYSRNATGGVSLNWIDGTAVNPADPLTWGSPEAEVGFRVEKAPLPAKKGDPLVWTTVATPLANQTSYTDALLAPDQASMYRVVAFNAAGDSAAMPVLVGPSVVTDPKTGLSTPVTAPLAPTTLASALQFGPKVVLTWTDLAVDETGFVLERATGAGAFVVVATPGAVDKTGTYTDTSVTGGNTYTYRIKAVNGGGESAYSNTASVTIMPAPAAPSNLVVTGAVTLKKESSVTLSWIDNSASESGFVLERATDAGFTANLVSTNIGPNVVTTTQTRLLPNTVYYFRIKAINLGGSSGWTSTVVMTPP